MTTRDPLVEGIEKTGYPFEIRVAEQLDKINYRYVFNHPVSVLPDAPNLPNMETSIDFKTWNENGIFFLIEAKRSAFSNWIFFTRERGQRVRWLKVHDVGYGLADPLLVRKSRIERIGVTICQGVSRVQSTLEVFGRVVKATMKGQVKTDSEPEKSSEEIRKAAQQASIAALSAWHDDYGTFGKGSQNVGRPRFYIPVVVTAAEISTVELGTSIISEDGRMTTENIERKPQKWVILRYPLPRPLWLPREEAGLDIDIQDILRKLDIAIVNINSLPDFLPLVPDILLP